MIEGSDATRGDDRHRHRIGDGPGQRNVETDLGAVPVHRREQDFAGAVGDHPFGPFDGVDAGLRPAAVGENLEPVRAQGFGVDGNNDALAAEFLRRLADELWIVHRRGIDRHLVRAREQKPPDVFDGPDAAADGHRHEALLGGAGDHIVDGVALLVAGGDIEKAELVGTGLVIDARLFHRIAGVDQIDELDPLDDPAAVDVETWNDAGFEHILILEPYRPLPSRRAIAAAGSTCRS